MSIHLRQTPKILVIYTGGTVGMIYDNKLRTLRPLGFSEIKEKIPEMYRLGYHYFVHSLKPPMDSSDIHPDIWIELAELIGRNYQYYDGFVILHGSDTMSFTASALSFLLEDLGKPVIITGSQLPIGEIRTDARENIITAIEVAAAKDENDQAMVPEVCIYFDFKLFRGNRTKKYDAEKFEAFYSMNYPTLAEAGVSIKYRKALILPQPEGVLKIHRKLQKDIAVLRLFPGIQKNTVRAILHTRKLKGVVLETFGSGNAPTIPWFITCIKEAVNRGVVVLNITQCDGGSVSLGQYETSKYLKEAGVITGFDMTFEAAITKLMFVLGLEKDPDTTKKLLQSALRGELTPMKKNHRY